MGLNTPEYHLENMIEAYRDAYDDAFDEEPDAVELAREARLTIEFLERESFEYNNVKKLITAYCDQSEECSVQDLGNAVRDTLKSVKDSGKTLDDALTLLGTFDDGTGVVDLNELKNSVCIVLDVLGETGYIASEAARLVKAYEENVDYDVEVCILSEVAVETLKAAKDVNISNPLEVIRLIEAYAGAADYEGDIPDLAASVRETLRELKQTGDNIVEVIALIDLYNESSEDIELEELRNAVVKTVRASYKTSTMLPEVADFIKVYDKISDYCPYVEELSDVVCKTLEYANEHGLAASQISEKLSSLKQDSISKAKVEYRQAGALKKILTLGMFTPPTFSASDLHELLVTDIKTGYNG